MMIALLRMQDTHFSCYESVLFIMVEWKSLPGNS